MAITVVLVANSGVVHCSLTVFIVLDYFQFDFATTCSLTLQHDVNQLWTGESGHLHGINTFSTGIRQICTVFDADLVESGVHVT